MSKSSSKMALGVATIALCAIVLFAGSRSAGAQEGLFTSERVADLSSLCAGCGWGLTTDTATATLIAALIGAASTIAVTILTAGQWFPAAAVTSSAARAVAWGGAILLYLIAINYIGGAIIIATYWNGAYEDFGAVRVAFPVLVGGVFTITSIWATGRILAG